MNARKLLIVGIDPGITTAYAVFDIEGKFIDAGSSKQLDLNSIISRIIKIGKAVLVGTDKSKAPGLVESFAAKIGARVVSPNEDLRVDEKRRMISGLDFADGHQADAAASALLAYKSVKPLLDKIGFFAKEHKKEDIKDLIKELVITKRISIRSAVAIIERKDEEEQIIEKVIVEKKLDENDFLRLYRKLKGVEAESRIVKSYNNNLKNTIKSLERKKPKAKPESRDTIDFREKRIKSLESVVKAKEAESEKLKSIIRKMNSMVSKINEFHVLKKLDTLGLKEYNFKNKVLDIKKNDMLLVDDPNIVSNDVIDILKNKVFIIIHKKPVSHKIENDLPFVFLSSKSLKIEEDKYFAFADRKNFEMEKGKLEWAKKMIDEYKKERFVSG